MVIFSLNLIKISKELASQDKVADNFGLTIVKFKSADYAKKNKQKKQILVAMAQTERKTDFVGAHLNI